MDFDELTARIANLEARVDNLEGAAEPVAEAPTEPIADPPAEYKIVAGVIRGFPGGTWGVIQDESHEPLNIKSVSVDGNRVIVNYGFTAKKVISLIAAPDEYYTQMGVSTGASVGKSATAVYFNKRPDTGYCDPMSLRSGNANVWIYGIFEV